MIAPRSAGRSLVICFEAFSLPNAVYNAAARFSLSTSKGGTADLRAETSSMYMVTVVSQA